MVRRFLCCLSQALLLTTFFTLSLPMEAFAKGKSTLSPDGELAVLLGDLRCGKEGFKDPKITVVFVADGAPKASIDKVNKFLKGGIKFLKNNGINYENVLHPHANCSTAQGHASLTTGTFPAYHGMVNNFWLDAQGNLFGATQDNDLQTAGVYDPKNGLIYNLNDPFVDPTTVQFYYPAGVSPRNYKVDNLSDQLVIFSTPVQKTKVFSISSAPEPAALMGGQLGKAFWLDPVRGLFTSSKYYYPNGLPNWVKKFNSNHPVPQTFTWKPLYPVGSEPYNFPGAQNYDYSVVLAPPYLPFTVIPPNQTLFNVTLDSVVPIFGAGLYISAPVGIEKTFDFAKQLINTQFDPQGDERLVLWFNVASFDTVASYLGTQTQEAIDVIYQLDKQLGEFIDFVNGKVNKNESLFVFCSDEGYYPVMPELLQQSGFDLAFRTIGEANGLPVPSMVAELNAALGIPYVQVVIPPFIYLDLALFDPLPPVQQAAVLQQIKTLVRSMPGMKYAWTADELRSWPFEREDQGRFFKLHLFANNPSTNPPQERRSGEIVFQTFPFNLVTGPDDLQPIHGMDHTSCYDYDAHTALYVYQRGRFADKNISEPVLIQQVAISLSGILDVPRPSAASVNIKPLPGIELKNR